MRILKANDLLEDIASLNNVDFENEENIDIDFSDVTSVDFNDIKTLLEFQKVALLNKKTLSLKNLKPDIKNLLDITGVNKTFANLATNPISAGR